MAVVNATGLKHARKNKFAPEYGGGIGFESYQFVIGAVALIIVYLVFRLFGFQFIGIGVAIAAAYYAANAPKYINTHNKHPRAYLWAEIRRRFQHTLIINDKRYSDPPDERESYEVVVCDFPTP